MEGRRNREDKGIEVRDKGTIRQVTLILTYKTCHSHLKGAATPTHREGSFSATYTSLRAQWGRTRPLRVVLILCRTDQLHGRGVGLPTAAHLTLTARPKVT